MTSVLTPVTFATLNTDALQAPLLVLHAALTVLLIVLLIEKELLRIYGATHLRERLAAYNVATVPLLLAFAFIALVRLARTVGAV